MTAASGGSVTALSVSHGHDRGHHRPVPHHGHRPRPCSPGTSLGSLIRTMVSAVLVVAVALGLGFRPTASAADWLAAAALFALLALAATWLSVAFGLVAKTGEAASNLPMPLFLLPFIGSAFVPTA